MTTIVIVWITGSGGARAFTALLGQELALDLGPTAFADEAIEVQRRDGTRRHIVGHTLVGEGQQTFVGLAFSGNALYWARVCGEGCSGVAFRYRNGRFAHARAPSSLAGFAVASSGSYWVTGNDDDICDPAEHGETCDVPRGSLTFKPGRDTHDGA